MCIAVDLKEEETEMYKIKLVTPLDSSPLNYPPGQQRYQHYRDSKANNVSSPILWRVGNFLSPPPVLFPPQSRRWSVGGFFAVISAGCHPSAGGPMLCNRYRYWKRISCCPVARSPRLDPRYTRTNKTRRCRSPFDRAQLNSYYILDDEFGRLQAMLGSVSMLLFVVVC